jgi:hypothetical protein
VALRSIRYSSTNRFCFGVSGLAVEGGFGTPNGYRAILAQAKVVVATGVP